MIPFDGFGCGRSLNWENQAIKIALKTNESCVHLNILTVIINMIPVVNDKNYLVKCQVRCQDCNQDYSKTSEKLTEKFLRFYGK